MFSTLVVIGSSIADTGNRCGLPGDPEPVCFPVPPYAGAGTASNGPLYVQILAARYGSPLVASRSGGFNYSYGGARTGVIPTDTVTHAVPSLRIQTEQFLQRVGDEADPRYLYIVDGTAFGNNARRVLELITENPALAATLPTQAVTAAANDIFTVVDRLYSAGARHVVLVNSPDLGTLPAFATRGPAAIRLARGMSTRYNEALAARVAAGRKAAAPELNVYYVDLGALSAEIAADPASFGFTNVRQPCYPFFAAPDAPVCGAPDAYVWWDELHPTAATHAIIAQRAVAAIHDRLKRAQAGSRRQP
jgi:phospholipase/lecithinase/hemolysin